MDPIDSSLKPQGALLQNKSQSATKTISKPFNPAFLISGVVLGMALFGFGGYYLGRLSQKQSIASLLSASPTLTPSSAAPVAPTLKAKQVLQEPDHAPSDWSYKDNGECGVRFAIPPKADPYYQPYDPGRPPSVTEDKGSGRFWDFPRGVFYPALLSKLATGSQEYKQAAASYAAADEAGGYISSAVVVSCIPNARALDNAGMPDFLKAKILAYNQDPRDKGMEAASYRILSVREVGRWGRNVYDVTMVNSSVPDSQARESAEEYAVFATPKYIYEIRILGATNDLFVKETAQQISQYLSFE